MGCLFSGALLQRQSKKRKVCRQYICQISLLLATAALLAFNCIDGTHTEVKYDLQMLVTQNASLFAKAVAYVVFASAYGASVGAYNYALKMAVYDKVRARNFARAWGFTQFFMGVSLLVGVPTAGKKTKVKALF